MHHLTKFIIINIIFFILFFYIAYKLHNYFLKKRNKKPNTFFGFINRGQHENLPGIKKLMVGFIFGIVFGFVDTLSLWAGVDMLQRYFPGGILTKTGFSNIYSDTVAVTVSTVISILVMDYSEYDISDIPIWANSVAVMIGCVFGLMFGRIVTGKS